MRKIFITFLFLLFLSAATGAVEYQSRLSTYYPSPFGFYQLLYLKPKSAFMSTPCRVGTMYFNPEGRLMVCQADTSGAGVWAPGAIWEEESDDVYLMDTSANPHLFLGLGSGSPEFKLTLEGDGGILAKGTFGSGATLTTAGPGTRFIWYPRKAAFRAGHVTGSQWDNANTGNYSFATGYNTTANSTATTAFGYMSTASDLYATAMGNNAIASGEAATAMGNQTTASGNVSTAFGYQTVANGFAATGFGNATEASGDVSTAMGVNTVASGFASTAFGYDTEASGDQSFASGDRAQAQGTNSVALGSQTLASGQNAVAAGILTVASGNNAVAMGYQAKAAGTGSFTSGNASEANGLYSVAIGEQAKAEGDYAIALGRNVIAQAFNSMAAGRYNIAAGDAHNWVATDPLFVIGNGTNAGSRNNAVTVLKNGNVGLGDSHPAASFVVHGIPEHADNTAATAAGLPTGSVYRTGDSLKVVH